LALRDFVFVMWKRQIDATGMNVECRTKIFHGHGGALDVPARAARPDRRFPEMLAGLWRFPKRKIPRAFFFIAIVVNTRSSLNAREINLGEFSVAREFCDA